MRRLRRNASVVRRNPSSSSGPPEHIIDAVQMPGFVGKRQTITPELVKTAREKFNLPVHAWTINEPEEMKKMTCAGVAGIITDYPGVLLKVLESYSPPPECKNDV